MELQRQEYPAMMATLPPGQAVAVLMERIKHVSKVNSDVADWLQERRRIEEAYVQGLRKLARKPIPDDSVDLGIFATPWSKVVESTDAIADSHSTLAQKIEADVERPLRDFATSNREMQAMSTISGNLRSMAVDIENAQKKADKLKEKGSKAANSKVAIAASEVENATSQWESQAPYVFEKLQAIDESRCNHLRDVLTQFQTHEVDQVERNRKAAEQALNMLLNIETADEIKTFSLKTAGGERPRAERTRSRPQASGSSAPSAPPVPSIPSVDENSSQRSGSEQKEQKSSGFGGLKRLGTVLGRPKNRRGSSQPYGRTSSPERKSASNLGSAFSSFGRSGRSKEAPPTPSLPRQDSSSRQLEDIPSSPRASEATSAAQTTRKSNEQPNGSASEPIAEESGPTYLNGTSLTGLQEPLQPSSAQAAAKESTRDAEGFSVKPSGLDAISQAEAEAAGGEEGSAAPFKVDIRNAPIQEEDADAETALANVANTLRLSAAPAKRAPTVRGRRDVRNTIFVPSPQTPDLAPEVTPTTSSTLPVPSSSLPASPPVPGNLDASPFKLNHRSVFLGDDHPASDTHSIRSARSFTSATSTTVRHPDLHSPGLNSSIVETVSAWFENGAIARGNMVGELALAYNAPDSSSSLGPSNIRLENFHVLEKVAPNPAFVEPVADKAGYYTVDLSNLAKTALAFKYQVHLDANTIASHAPLLLAPAWKIEATHSLVVMSYSLSPAFVLPPGKTSVTLTNVMLAIHLDVSGAKASSAQSAPAGGVFSKDRQLIYWRFDELTLSSDSPAQQLKAKFITDSEAKAGAVEARWEVGPGEHVDGLGSGLSVAALDPVAKSSDASAEHDPFADEEAAAAKPEEDEGTWKEATIVRKIKAGTYSATS
ncbi:hypothetical protein K402DRAFT_342919 [Aulographum hederae CBS 113979]|uniref:MHD domain-containing protein n=1 Tax=Aulographum hederae CBS 113979 TaxID=1176131 RepID=A0A6G1GK10_9PEZI|nr:hypothetical protein K402DRAFT_342919 [Aulographum hederae CBS 113979]